MAQAKTSGARGGRRCNDSALARRCEKLAHSRAVLWVRRRLGGEGVAEFYCCVGFFGQLKKGVATTGSSAS